MTISIIKSSRIVALAVGTLLVLAVAFGGMASSAQALTQAEATTIIQILGLTGSQAAAIQALVSGSSSTTSLCTFTRNLTIGATGSDVTCLQENLINLGFSIPAGATGYFGTQTRAAVAAWQASKNVSPPVGYFGPISQGAWATMGTPGTPGTPSTPSGLSGGAGSISDADYISNLNNEQVGEGSNDVEVAGLELEADDGSDIELTAVNLNFSPGAGVGSNDFDEYADEVSVWVDGKEVARVDADMFRDDQNFDRTISLSPGGIIRAGKTGDLVVAVSGVNNIDSADAGDTWNLEFENVRFRDAQGASITDSATGDINDATGRNFTVDTFATANDVELKATSKDNTPEGVINVHASDDTDGVELLRFTLEAEGGDIRIQDFPINFATSTNNVDADQTLALIASSVYLKIGSEEWSENGSAAVQGLAGATVTFDDVDYDIDEGDKVTVIVSADINDIDAGTFDEGDQLTASFTADNRGVLTAEDQSGEDLVAGDKTGTGLGQAVAFYDVGIMVSLVSTSREVTSDADAANTDTGTFTIVFNVEAFDGTVYVSDNTAPTTTTDVYTAIDETEYRLTIGGVATALATSISDAISYTTSGGASDSTNGNIQLEDGESTEISLIVSRTNTATNPGGIVQLLLQSIAWDTVDNTYANNTNAYNNFRFDLEDYKTSPMSLN